MAIECIKKEPGFCRFAPTSAGVLCNANKGCGLYMLHDVFPLQLETGYLAGREQATQGAIKSQEEVTRREREATSVAGSKPEG